VTGLHYGEVPGFPAGATFGSFEEMRLAGVHRSKQAGIAGGKDGADSIVVNGGYPDDCDYGDVIIYTGQGGRDDSTKRQVADQELTYGNAGLVRTYADGQPIRVIRGARGDGANLPATGYRYDGLYSIKDVWSDINPDGFLIWRFHLEKIGTATASDRNEVRTTVRRPKRRLSRQAGKKQALVTVRIGQQKFRTELITRYGLNCAVTGRCPKEVLDAAHLRAFSKVPRHDVKEGLLLRADIHRLFDAGRLVVDVRKTSLVIHPDLATHRVYGPLDGQPLTISTKLMPRLEALMEHYAEATSSWS
jgi:putative restriction endonuclease